MTGELPDYDKQQKTVSCVRFLEAGYVGVAVFSLGAGLQSLDYALSTMAAKAAQVRRRWCLPTEFH
ncbi:MAG: hypothetical protein AAGJ86_11980, partial [Pseudomonadota bacterium]